MPSKLLLSEPGYIKFLGTAAERAVPLIVVLNMSKAFTVVVALHSLAESTIGTIVIITMIRNHICKALLSIPTGALKQKEVKIKA